MNNYINLIKKNNLKVNKITIKGNFIFINTPLGLFVIKQNENIKNYDYLLSRGFNYFPKIIDYDNSNILFKYIDNIEYDLNLKAVDFIRLLSFLHSKTSYYVNINKEEIYDIYNSIKTRIEDLINYYDKLVNEIEEHLYYSPSEYLLIRNISIIYSSLYYCHNEINNFYEKYKNNDKKRVSTQINNYDLNYLIKSKDEIYLTNFENIKVDRVIYDLVNFYNLYYNDFDLNYLLKIYQKVIPLTNEEIDLFLILISIPDKIKLSNNLNDLYDINLKITKVYKTVSMLNLKKEEKSENHKSENNKN